MEQLDKCVDVIIPIYNAYEELLLCIESVQKHTNLNRHRLILINDLSSDERIVPFLNQLASEQIIVIHNEINKGFSANINNGLTKSHENDVLLLNSDTVVTENWLEKIVTCAYSDKNIATVTPLSNNATIYSIPKFYEDNKLPEGFTVDEFAALVEKCSLKKYPVMPVAHGFCMFIKREVINKIGDFDAETFGQGYGEENDFCYRAEQLGYHQVMCDDTFIYHSGTSSFLSEEKKRYIESHEKIVEERYPLQHRNAIVHCLNRPNEDIRINVKVQTALQNNKKNIMYLLHSDFRSDSEDNVGGTQLHVKDLCDGLREDMNIFVAARNHNYLNLTAYIGEQELFFQYYIGEEPVFPVYRDLEFEKLYATLLSSFRIDIVHIHHTSGLTLELYYQAAKIGIPIFTTVHDFYTICPTIKLINQDGMYCKDIATPSMCRTCLAKRCGITSSIDFMSKWREEQKQALKLSDRIFVPSESAKDIFLTYYPELLDKIFVITHGSRKFEMIEDRLETEKKSSKFNVAFVGGISEAKGSYCASQMIKQGALDIQWHLFGVFGDNRLSMIDKKNYIKTGIYQREQLPTLIKKYQIDLICILPIWPETFCYTLSEAVLCGVPVIVTDIGALGERVRKLQCGWVVHKDATPTEVLDKISLIKDKGKEYQEKKNYTRTARIKSLMEMCREYQDLYDNAVSDSIIKQDGAVDYRWILKGRGKALGQADLLGVDNQIYEQLAMAEHQLKEITSSTAYKFARIVADMKVPFKKQIKSVLIRGYSFIKKRR